MACCFGGIDKASWVHFLISGSNIRSGRIEGNYSFLSRIIQMLNSSELGIEGWGSGSISSSAEQLLPSSMGVRSNFL